MTRINCIPPHELTRQHLFAEIRELPRLRHMQPRQNVPDSYRMGSGHVIFFMNKGEWLEKRHAELLSEWYDRGYDCNIPSLKLNWDNEFMQDWKVDDVAIRINRERIKEKLK